MESESGGRGEQVERAGGAILLEVGCEGGPERKEWREMQDKAAVAFAFCLFALRHTEVLQAWELCL